MMFYQVAVREIKFFGFVAEKFPRVSGKAVSARRRSTGDALTPLLDAIDADPQVVAAGWRGVNVDLGDEWRSFVDAGPGDVDALLGYLFAMRRSAALAAGGPHPKARFYRNADMEWSFLLREQGKRLVAVELPVRQDRHRGYHDSDPVMRDRESKKTYDRFLQRFRGREDLRLPR